MALKGIFQEPTLIQNQGNCTIPSLNSNTGVEAYQELRFLQGIVSKLLHSVYPQPSKQGLAQSGSQYLFVD